ncbi:MAG TPA: hypothetical protein VMR49_00620 [Candidatus Paceibacterota bacterium]|nr:hypothetical protein [Candidatus Paceibacterota bacterium]
MSTVKIKSENTTIKWIFWGIFFVVLLFIINSGIKSCNRDGNSKKDNSSNTNKIEQPELITMPPHDAMVIKINSSLSNGTIMPAGYNTIFDCNQPYQVVDQNGKTYDGEIGKDVNIGFLYSYESTANLLLRFRTRNGAKTEMRISFIPLTIKNPAR